MRVAVVVRQFPALSETFVLNQITGLIDRGHEVDIYTTLSKVMPTPVEHSDVLTYNLRDRTTYLSFQDGDPVGINRRPYDVIHCHFGPSGLIAVKLREAGALQGKILTTFHGYDVASYPRLHGPNVYRDLFLHGELFTVNTRHTGARAIALGCPAEKIVSLPIGVDLKKFHFAPRALRPNETIRILTVARLVEKKGLEYAVHAFACVARWEPRLAYRIVGDGPLRGSIERLIAHLGMDGRIQLLGWKNSDDVRGLYADSHLFILPSVTAASGDQEGQGLVLQEAQATGLPVIATLHNGMPDGVVDGESGFLVPERDVEALESRLSDLVIHPETWPSLGRRGRAHVEERYNIDTLNDRLVAIYRHLLGRDAHLEGRGTSDV